MTDVVSVLGGMLLLYVGAEWFVRGASALALALRVPQILVGLTVVAYGTSAPEVIVGISAARAGHGDVALGNVIGSNVANVGLILGLSTLLQPARADASLRNREVPVLLLSALAVPALLLDGVVSIGEAVGLLLAALAYTLVMVRAARAAGLADARTSAAVTADAADVAGAPATTGSVASLVTAVIGLGVLLLGGHLFVEGAVSVARALGMSDRVVGLTIVAVGTSLPELVTSLVAASRGHADIAVGNVIGSNIFNVLLCLGAASLAGSVGAPLASLGADLVLLIVMSALVAVFARTERLITRGEGALALGLWVAFTAHVVSNG